jgi:hypothetical protein
LFNYTNRTPMILEKGKGRGDGDPLFFVVVVEEGFG